MIDAAPEVYTVAGLNNYVKTIIDNDIALNALFMIGEISNFKAHSSGHMYMTLKDKTSAIKAVMFRGDASRLRFMPKDGMNVLVFGRVSVYERDGQYQFYIKNMQPDGIGSLNLAFEQLKEKLGKEGLFDASHKKALPEYPKTIGVVTSETGAAFQDIRNVLSRRWPLARIVISPTQVQGETAAPMIAEALRALDESGEADVIILARGGGSIEDLWCFNDERVARTIYAMNTPLISGVGHEVDYTIADFVADCRAPTPSAAAEVAAPDVQSELSRIKKLELSAERCMVDKLGSYRSKLDSFTQRNVMKGPMGLIDNKRLTLDNYTQKMENLLVSRLDSEKARYSVAVGRLDAFSPLKVLSRGYSIAENKNGVINSIKYVSIDDELKLRVSDGVIKCTVTDVSS